MNIADFADAVHLGAHPTTVVKGGNAQAAAMPAPRLTHGGHTPEPVVAKKCCGNDYMQPSYLAQRNYTLGDFMDTVKANWLWIAAGLGVAVFCTPLGKKLGLRK